MTSLVYSLQPQVPSHCLSRLLLWPASFDDIADAACDSASGSEVRDALSTEFKW